MRTIGLILSALILITGCGWTGQLLDSPGHNSTAYFGGRGMYVVIHEIAKDSIPELEARYNRFLDATVNVLVIEPTQSQELFNDLILILSKQTDDPYALINDLAFLLSQFGAEFSGEGTDKQMVSIQPAPRSLYVAFSQGWKASSTMQEYRDK